MEASIESGVVSFFPQSDKMIVELVGVRSSNTIVLKKFPVVIGRDDEVDVQLDDPEVAIYQCMLDWTCGSVVVWDLQTGPRIHVNGVPVTKSSLMPGDKLTLGRTEFVVQFHDDSRRLLADALGPLHDIGESRRIPADLGVAVYTPVD